ncbi:c-type cytochrome [Aquirhabdus parva]|uniref:Cytochrome c5 family protein n=1 Tax=Aquirhabdus parva TaxID=2283318 RepID=A0A345P3M5_9GAMM|nr:c-type cytochrome [Aquirhabdus parva]AXI01884.1 cytochrome c5 family protein [Aquirhabdus parva]
MRNNAVSIETVVVQKVIDLKVMALAVLIFLVIGVSSAWTSRAHAADTNELYKQSCATCHGAGVLGAPKAGDTAAWSARLKAGIPALVKHTKEGYKNMPARGLCNTCTDDDYANLIKLMAK